jgi:prepilin-type N-terminal cleavage/methylation domain-containing protein
MIVQIERSYGEKWQSEATRSLIASRGVVSKQAGGTPVALRGFTLIEMILVMALLVIAVSFVTPHLQGFFRGRTLQSEGRQLISLMHNGQSRAVSGGVPVRLWFDTQNNKYGLEEEPGFNDKDPDAMDFTPNENLRIEIPNDDPSMTQPAVASTAEDTGEHAGLPKITFQPDGSIADTSPRTIRIVDSAGPVLSLTQTRDRNEYEIATTNEQQ